MKLSIRYSPQKTAEVEREEVLVFSVTERHFVTLSLRKAPGLGVPLM